ncbi:MAG: hypothetical protein ACQBVK_02410 [Candidatus Phytoplasma sp. TWB_XP]
MFKFIFISDRLFIYTYLLNDPQPPNSSNSIPQNNDGTHYPNYEKEHKSLIYKYNNGVLFFLGGVRHFYEITGVPQVSCQSYEEIINLSKIEYKNKRKEIGKLGPGIDKGISYLLTGTNLGDKISNWTSGNIDSIATKLNKLQDHLKMHPEDSYFFFNPKGQLSEIEKIEFGFCDCKSEHIKNEEIKLKLK